MTIKRQIHNLLQTHCIDLELDDNPEAWCSEGTILHNGRTFRFTVSHTPCRTIYFIDRQRLPISTVDQFGKLLELI